MKSLKELILPKVTPFIIKRDDNEDIIEEVNFSIPSDLLEELLKPYELKEWTNLFTYELKHLLGNWVHNISCILYNIYTSTQDHIYTRLNTQRIIKDIYQIEYINRFTTSWNHDITNVYIVFLWNYSTNEGYIKAINGDISDIMMMFFPKEMMLCLSIDEWNDSFRAHKNKLYNIVI